MTKCFKLVAKHETDDNVRCRVENVEPVQDKDERLRRSFAQVVRSFPVEHRHPDDVGDLEEAVRRRHSD